MCLNPSPTTMASPNQKVLNPDATPFAKSETIQLKIGKPFFQQSIYETQPLQHSTPPVSMAGHLVYWYQQPRSSWAYPVAQPVYYDAHEQPSVAMRVPFYFNHLGKDSVRYSTRTQAALVNRKVPDVRVEEERDMDSGGKEKKVFNRFSLKRQAPRFRHVKRQKFVSCGERTWLPKNYKLDRRTCGSDAGNKLEKKGDDDKPVCNTEEINFGGKTSLMIRNIPNQFGRHNLMDILDQHCLEENRKARQHSDPSKSEYDFLYLPMDFRNRANYGYAFVNLTNTAGALRFQEAFDKFKWDVSLSKKTCEICFAKIQGKEALKNHFKNSVFPCDTSGYLPVVLSPPRDGEVRSNPTVIGRMERRRRRNCCQSDHVLKN